MHAMDLQESGGRDDPDMDVTDRIMFKGAGGAAESAADRFGTTEWSAEKPPIKVKEVSRVRQEFPEAWIWTETHTKYFKIYQVHDTVIQLKDHTT